MRRCTIVFLVALLTMSISAAPVDVEQARSVALSFLKSNRPQTKSSLTPQLIPGGSYLFTGYRFIFAHPVNLTLITVKP